MLDRLTQRLIGLQRKQGGRWRREAGQPNSEVDWATEKARWAMGRREARSSGYGQRRLL